MASLSYVIVQLGQSTKAMIASLLQESLESDIAISDYISRASMRTSEATTLPYRRKPTDFPVAGGQGHQDPGIRLAPVQDGDARQGILENPDSAAADHGFC
ncbi:hypothetical protein AB9E19_03825 [Rhizobium leguminosarum]|uniref:hypothetical protein n=1 Tax=Rhizobium leguminosarum TaxID=384 RepID=UPI003F9537C1